MTVSVLAGSYDGRLVVLSVLIAIFASYAALDLAGQGTLARRARLLWLGGAATAMGIGIWAAHYVGMLAFRLPVPMLYDWPTVLLSLLAAISASAAALLVISRPRPGLLRATVGSLLMGGGIASLDYIGMAAMRLPAERRYEPRLAALSVALAVVISFAALWLTSRLRGGTKGRGPWRAFRALILGAAIPAMHYTGMAAARFTAPASPRNIAQERGSLPQMVAT